MVVCLWWWIDWSFARLIAPVVTTTSIILCFNKHWLTQVHLENCRWNRESIWVISSLPTHFQNKLKETLVQPIQFIDYSVDCCNSVSYTIMYCSNALHYAMTQVQLLLVVTFLFQGSFVYATPPTAIRHYAYNLHFYNRRESLSMDVFTRWLNWLKPCWSRPETWLANNGQGWEISKMKW